MSRPKRRPAAPIGKIRDGDIIRLDADAGTLEALVGAEEWDARDLVTADLSGNEFGVGRELFASFRALAAPAEEGAGMIAFGGSG